jgi:hypothetical protein
MCTTHSKEIAGALKALETPLRWATLDELTGSTRKQASGRRR